MQAHEKLSFKARREPPLKVDPLSLNLAKPVWCKKVLCQSNKTFDDGLLEALVRIRFFLSFFPIIKRDRD